MASEPEFVSVVITVRNEERHLQRLLDSLSIQEPPFEVVLVDALSTDRTLEIAQSFARTHPEFRVLSLYGSRGVGRNAGVRASRGTWITFIDGDCFADTNWLRAFRTALRRAPAAAGKTVAVGPPEYVQLERVELYQSGSDVTFPSCNLAYRRDLFDRLGGFDPRFITAEDIDLNLRAVRGGATLHYVPEATVYHEVRPTIFRFLYQAFWNGYGRKQLTEKHGSLWSRYRYRRLLSGQRTVIAWARLVAALSGYFVRVLTGGGRRLAPGPVAIKDAESAAPA